MKDTTLSHSKQHFWKRKKFWIGLLIIVGIIAVPCGAIEFMHQMRVSALSSEVDRIGRDVVKPKGGILQGSNVKCPHFLDTVGWVSGPCPDASSSWLVLIDPNNEADFIRSALQITGYSGGVSDLLSPERTGGGSKGTMSVSLGFYPPNNVDSPYAAPEGKAWKLFDISVNDFGK